MVLRGNSRIGALLVSRRSTGSLNVWIRSPFETSTDQIEEYGPKQIEQRDQEDRFEPFAKCVHAAGCGLPVDDRLDRCSRRQGFDANQQFALERHTLVRKNPSRNKKGDLKWNAPVQLQLANELLVQVLRRRRAVHKHGDE